MTEPARVTHTLTVHNHRIPFMQREKSAYLILRRKGLSINIIAKAFGRSTSVIHRALVKVEKYGYNITAWGRRFRRLDLRKLPCRRRLHNAAFNRWKLGQTLSQWEAWILGEGDRPP